MAQLFTPVQLPKQTIDKLTHTLSKIDKVNTFNLFLQFVNSKPHNDWFEFLFTLSIVPTSFSGPGSITTIKKEDLKRRIEAEITKGDEKYIKLESFTYQKAIFRFDIDAWLNDCLRNANGSLFSSKWDRTFKLAKLPPHMTRVYAMRLDINKYIATYFKKYVASHLDLQRHLTANIPKDIAKSLGVTTENLFDYSYDYMSNRIIARLKPLYVTLMVYTITQLTNKKMFGFGRV